MKNFHKDLIQDYGKAISSPIQYFRSADYVRFAKRFRTFYSHILPQPREGRVLDVGCGDGQFLYYLKQEGFLDIEGIDASEDRLELCRRHVTQHVSCADAIDWLDSHRETYDIIFSHHVLEHFRDEDLMRFVKALSGSLTADGTLILTTPNACSPWAGYNLYHDLTHCRLFTTDSLTQLLNRVDLEATFYSEGATAFDIPSTLRWAVWKLREVWLKMAFRIDIGGMRGGAKTPLIVSPNLIAVARKTKAVKRHDGD